jgi:glycosyltransferase involved in cell wall biosynthesis
MTRITATVITQNEEKNIGSCLRSLNWVDEIVVYDACSKDQTVPICEHFGARVFQNHWPGYKTQKNNAIDKASNDWILALDADEQLSSELIQEIKTLRQEGFQKDGYRIPRRSFYLGKWINYSGWYPDRQLRLFKKSKARWDGGTVHEHVSLNGDIGDLAGDLLHYSYRNINHHLQKIEIYSDLIAKDAFQNGIRSHWLHLIGNPVKEFFSKLVLKAGYRDHLPGIVIAALSAYYHFQRVAKLRALERRSVTSLSSSADKQPDKLQQG